VHILHYCLRRSHHLISSPQFFPRSSPPASHALSSVLTSCDGFEHRLGDNFATNLQVFFSRDSQVEESRNTSQLFDTEAMTRDFEVTANVISPLPITSRWPSVLELHAQMLSFNVLRYSQGLVSCALELHRGGWGARGKGGRWHHCLRGARHAEAS
jgi:hypothetical protein